MRQDRRRLAAVVLIAWMAPVATAWDAAADWLSSTNIQCTTDYAHGCCECSNALDGDSTTTYHNTATDLGNQSIVFDFGQSHTLSRFREYCDSLRGSNTALKDFELAVAPASTGPWTLAAEGQGAQQCSWSDTANTFTFPAATGRFWKLTLLSNYQSSYALTISEIEFFGVLTTAFSWSRNSSQCDVTSASFTDCLTGLDDSCAHGVGANSAGQIPDVAITSNGMYQDDRGNPDWAFPYYARLGHMGVAWFPASDTVADFVSYDLGEIRVIAGMKAEGAYSTGDDNGACSGGRSINCPYAAMKEFTIKYSTDNRSWVPLATKAGALAQVFPGPCGYNCHGSNPSSMQSYSFPSSTYPHIVPFEARHIRIYLHMSAAYGFSSIQAEFYGPPCQITAFTPVGLGSYAVKDSAMTEQTDFSRNANMQGPAQARLMVKNSWTADKRGCDACSHSAFWERRRACLTCGPNGNDYNWQTNMWMQVDLGQAFVVGAVATQGGGVSFSNYWVTQYKLGGSVDGVSFSTEGDLLQGNVDSDTVVKNYVTPFTARYVRVLPWSMKDGYMATLRLELYATMSAFQWTADGVAHLSDHTSLGAVGTDAFCNQSKHDLASSFRQWTPGMAGDGMIYVSAPHSMQLNSEQYSATAYQRRRCDFTGMMTKTLLCFKKQATGAEKCCVDKAATSLNRGAWDQQESEVKMS
jgi:hypothetical protein